VEYTEFISEDASTLIIPKDCYQKTSGLTSASRSLISILNPLIATALYSFAGMNLIVAVDLCTFPMVFTLIIFMAGARLRNYSYTE